MLHIYLTIRSDEHEVTHNERLDLEDSLEANTLAIKMICQMRDHRPTVLYDQDAPVFAHS